ncbi:RNA-binding S4 domain-containing protein [Raphanus sativus]|nr:RNA-binding S4 domain-containing protein [Raphanus sativus]
MSRCRSNVGDVRASPQRSWRPSIAKEVKHILEMARRATSRREVLHTDFVTHPVVKKSVSVLGKLADVAGRLPLGWESSIPLLALEYESPRTNTFKTIEASLRIDAVPSAGFKVSLLKLVDLIR